MAGELAPAANHPSHFIAMALIKYRTKLNFTHFVIGVAPFSIDRLVLYAGWICPV